MLAAVDGDGSDSMSYMHQQLNKLEEFFVSAVSLLISRGFYTMYNLRELDGLAQTNL